MKVYLKQIDNFSLAAKAESNHWLSIDERVEDGGNGAVVDVGGGLFGDGRHINTEETQG